MDNLKILNFLIACTIVLIGLNRLSIIYPQNVAAQDNPVNISSLVYDIDMSEAKAHLHPKLITVNNDGKISCFLTTASNTVNALLELNISLSNRNRIVSTAPFSSLYNNTFIHIQTYKTMIEEINLNIPYEIIVKGGSLCANLSEKVTQQKGVLGVMTQRIKKIYEGRDLLTQEVIDQNIVKAPRAEIIVIKGPNDSPSSVPQRGYDCVYWHSYVDNLNASQEEKQWLKFAMKLESGCNAESNSNQYYKGLLQWDPCLWYKQFPNENIFDGEAQIKRSLQKLRNGADPSRMWPNVYSRYVEKYGALSWLD